MDEETITLPRPTVEELLSLLKGLNHDLRATGVTEKYNGISFKVREIDSLIQELEKW